MEFGTGILPEQGISWTLEEDEGHEGSHKKLATELAAIFGVRADAYSSDSPPPPPLPRVDPKRRTTPTDGGYNKGDLTKLKKRRRDNKSDNENGSRGGDANNKNRRKCV